MQKRIVKKRIVKETLANGTIQYRVEKFAKPVFFLKRRWITDTVLDPFGEDFIEFDAVFDTLEEAEEHIFEGMANPVVERELVKINNERFKESC